MRGRTLSPALSIRPKLAQRKKGGKRYSSHAELSSRYSVPIDENRKREGSSPIAEGRTDQETYGLSSPNAGEERSDVIWMLELEVICSM